MTHISFSSLFRKNNMGGGGETDWVGKKLTSQIFPEGKNWLGKKLTVKPGWVILGLISTKQRIMCLAQGHTVIPVRLEPATPWSWAKNSTTEPLPSSGIPSKQLNFCRGNNWAATCDFQRCGILTSVDSDEAVQPPSMLRNSKWCSVSSLTLIEYSSD